MDFPNLPASDEVTVGVIGLGYVGLPLALAFAKRYKVIGFDTDPRRVLELDLGRDSTGEVGDEALLSKGFVATSEESALSECNVFLVAVPTPVDDSFRPELTPLVQASELVGRVMRPGSVVVYESTVYPGTTEEVCVPILESESGLKLNAGFSCGYSPERINPGDRKRTLESIRKITSGSSDAATGFIDELYRSVIPAGTYVATSIKVAEAAKVVENVQRDVNIALMNELAMVFDVLGIDTHDVLSAARTKWNFMPFEPGLVGGHCIGVDPYYLTHKATVMGFHPELMLASRRINDRMGKFVGYRIVRLLIKSGIPVAGSKALILGLSFKENCSDLRNTKVLDIVKELEELGVQVDVCDPLVSDDAASSVLDGELVRPRFGSGAYDAVVLAVAHDHFLRWSSEDLRSLCTPKGIVFDVKGVLPVEVVTERL